MSYKSFKYSIGDSTLRISTGNIKLGGIHNISIPPILSCINKPPCFKDCYALKAYRQYNSTRNAWNTNLECIQSCMKHGGPRWWSLHNTIYHHIKRYKVKYFRIHVSGDFNIFHNNHPLNQSYYRIYETLAGRIPDTNFLVFTKYFKLECNGRPSNLKVLWSHWSNWPIIRYDLDGVAYMQDHNNLDDRIPSNCLICDGHCETCFKCFKLQSRNDFKIVFHKH